MTDTAPDAAPEAAPARLQIVRAGPVRLLRNLSDVEATVVSFTSRASIWGFPGPDDVTNSDAPCMEVRGIPARTDVVIEAVDPYEDGHLSFSLVRAEWADGRRDLGLQGDPPRALPVATEVEPGGVQRLEAITAALHAGLPVPDAPAPPPRAERAVRKIDSVPGRVRYGMFAGAPDDAASTPPEPLACVSCRHLLSMIGVGQGLRCTHPAHNPDPDARPWTIPGRWYTCPVYQPHSDA